MARTWARSELDMQILEMLYDYKSLRGTTLAKICTPYDMQKTYNRIMALVRIGILNSASYMEQDARQKEKSVGGFKKRGQMYFLTGEGVKAVKEYRGLLVQDYERGVEVTSNQLKSLYTASILIENIRLPFTDGRNFKLENELPNYITIDLVYKDWVIFVERTQTNQYRKKQCQIVRGLKEKSVIDNVMIICPSEALAVTSAKVWKNELAPDVKFMSRDNTDGIESFLKGIASAEIVGAMSVFGKVAELHQPSEGYTHVLDGEKCIVKNLKGFSPQVMRQVNSSLLEYKKKYLVAEKATHLPYIVRHFPELLKPEHTFVTLDGICETSEALQSVYGRRRA